LSENGESQKNSGGGNGSDSDEEGGKTKWTTLEHKGMTFPPAYKPLPASV